MRAYYNEFDLKAAAWLRQLIKNGMIADGEVDERSILDVTQDDLKGFTQHHFFAGIGGWSYALRLAGWADDRPVCTASLPCQPFSLAGKGKGKADERHLLPHFIELVKQCNFQTIFGEQVPSAIKHGWLDDLCTEMEREKYTVGSIVLTASGTGAPHIRQRLYWVADSSKQRQSGQRQMGQPINPTEAKDRQINRAFYVSNIGDNRESGGLGNTELHGHDASQSGRSLSESEVKSGMLEPERSDSISRICNSESDKKHTGTTGGLHAQFSHERSVNDWDNPDWIYCRDEKYRPIKSGIEPLVNGLPRGVGYSSNPSEPIDANNTQEVRVMRLKGYGNAIVPQVAAQFIKAANQGLLGLSHD